MYVGTVLYTRECHKVDAGEIAYKILSGLILELFVHN